MGRGAGGGPDVISFTDIDSFATELTLDEALVERKIVRIAFEYEQRHAYGLENVYLLATARVGKEIARCRVYCGERFALQGDTPQNRAVAERADELELKLGAALEGAGFEIRRGVVS